MGVRALDTRSTGARSDRWPDGMVAIHEDDVGYTRRREILAPGGVISLLDIESVALWPHPADSCCGTQPMSVVKRHDRMR